MHRPLPLAALLAAALLPTVLPAAAHAATMVQFTTGITYSPASGQVSSWVVTLDDTAPITKANFLQYVTNNNYDSTVLHRSVYGFVIQGGGYVGQYANGSFTGFAPIVSYGPIQNEFSPTRSNVAGTIAMAKVGGDPNSATNQWFVNMADNSANLDTQNGGFTVFGTIDPAGFQFLTVLNNLPTYNLTQYGGAFTDVPLLNGNLLTIYTARVVNQWQATAGGAWGSTANWSTNAVPDSPYSYSSAPVYFGPALASSGTVDLQSTGRRVQCLTFNSTTASYTIAASTGGILTLTGSTGGLANITFDPANTRDHTISAPLTLTATSTSIALPANTLTLSGPLTNSVNAVGKTIGKYGAGTLVISGPQTHGTGALFNVYGGNVVMYTDAGSSTAATLAVTVGKASDPTQIGAITFSHSEHLKSLTLNNTSTATMDASPMDNVLVTSALTLAGGTTPTAKLDLTKNDLIVQVPAGQDVNAAYTTLLAQLAAGAAGGLWTGTTGITSSATGVRYALGIVKNADLAAHGGSYTTFDGEAVDANSILIRYTDAGDANLDGQLTPADYALLDAAYSYNLAHPTTPLTGWLNGDFNYDGKVDAQDYFLLDHAYHASHPPSGTSPVPEPASLGLLALGSLTLLRRRV